MMVIISGYWDVQFIVMVSFVDMQFFKVVNSVQDQSIECMLGVVIEILVGLCVYQFMLMVMFKLVLVLSLVVLNVLLGELAIDIYISGLYIIVVNCVSIMLNVILKSFKGLSVGFFYWWSIRWCVEYWNGSLWVMGVFWMVNMGDQITIVQNDLVMYIFLFVGIWQWCIYVEQFNIDGILFGVIVYDIFVEMIMGSGVVSVNFVMFGVNGLIVIVFLMVLFLISMFNLLWEFYQIDYIVLVMLQIMNLIFLSQNWCFIVNVFDGVISVGWQVVMWGILSLMIYGGYLGGSGCVFGMSGIVLLVMLISKIVFGLLFVMLINVCIFYIVY